MAVTALAMTASSASADEHELPVEVSNEATTDHCSAVTIVGHHVEGGCHVDFVSPAGTDIPLHAYIPNRTTISNCEVYLEGQVDENGEGYVTEAILSPPHNPGVPCTRTACDEEEPSHEMLPWPFHIREHGPDNEEVEATFCLRDNDPELPEGTQGIECEVHLEFTDLGNHQYEIGHATETFCENNAPNPTTHPTTPVPVSVEVHLISGPERVEVAH
jgi:hypothetical protein